MKSYNFDLSESDIVYILNCLSITMNYLYYHTPKEKEHLSLYFNFNNYTEDMESLRFLHRRLSCSANKCFYNESNNIIFIGQQRYFTNKDFSYLKEVPVQRIIQLLNFNYLRKSKKVLDK